GRLCDTRVAGRVAGGHAQKHLRRQVLRDFPGEMPSPVHLFAGCDQVPLTGVEAVFDANTVEVEMWVGCIPSNQNGPGLIRNRTNREHRYLWRRRIELQHLVRQLTRFWLRGAHAGLTLEHQPEAVIPVRT